MGGPPAGRPGRLTLDNTRYGKRLDRATPRPPPVDGLDLRFLF